MVLNCVKLIVVVWTTVSHAMPSGDYLARQDALSVRRIRLCECACVYLSIQAVRCLRVAYMYAVD